MLPEKSSALRPLVWTALLFSAVTFAVSWWHWWTFQYSTFDLAFYVQALWLALRGQWHVSLLNVPLMGNHAEPIVFLLTPFFALCPHPMLFVAVQTLAFATMPFTAYRIGKHLQLEPSAALFMALSTLLTPAAFSIGIHEFHPEALSAPLLLLLIEARLTERYGRFWLWFVAVLSVKENMAPLLVALCAVFAVLEWRHGRKRQLLWNVLPALLATSWLLIYAKLISPALNAGNVDYLQLYGHLGKTPGDIVRNFFLEPHRAFAALHKALTKGDMIWALLLPFLTLPLFRPRWLLIAAPLLAQHLLSFRPSEWSLGAHYPAPFLPLFWIAAAEALRRLRWQSQIATAVLCACVLAHLRFGEVRALAAELPHWATLLEEREWKAQFLEQVPAKAAVTTGLGFLPHLATREHLFSLHHVLKGLKTLSAETYTPPPADFVLIDYEDTMTFNTEAGYYHPWSRRPGGGVIASSDRLLHDYLQPGPWTVTAKNSVTALRHGPASNAAAFIERPIQLDEQTTFAGIQVTKRLSGALQLRISWQLAAERKKFPWLTLVFSDGKRLYPILKGACAVEAGSGTHVEDWSVVYPSVMPPGKYAFFAQFYDGVEAAWAGKLPPNDSTFTLALINLGEVQIQPGNFASEPRD